MSMTTICGYVQHRTHNVCTCACVRVCVRVHARVYARFVSCACVRVRYVCSALRPVDMFSLLCVRGVLYLLHLCFTLHFISPFFVCSRLLWNTVEEGFFFFSCCTPNLYLSLSNHT